MNLEYLTPVGGGELRGPAAPSITRMAGTFTPTAIQHPDEIWSPRGSEIAPPQRPFTPSPDYANTAESERPVQVSYMSHADVAGNVRAALRPGSAGSLT
jgi:hypothetical protein